MGQESLPEALPPLHPFMEVISGAARAGCVLSGAGRRRLGEGGVAKEAAEGDCGGEGTVEEGGVWVGVFTEISFAITSTSYLSEFLKDSPSRSSAGSIEETSRGESAPFSGAKDRRREDAILAQCTTGCSREDSISNRTLYLLYICEIL
jgi:hypothetical protein